MASIMLNVIMSNGFGAELDLQTFELIILRFKIAPVIFISMIFRCSSFVMITTLLRFYSAFPVLLIWLMSRFIRKMRSKHYLNEESFSVDLWKCRLTKKSASVPYTIIRLLEHSGELLTGPVLAEIHRYAWSVCDKAFIEKVKKSHDMSRKQLFFFDATMSLATHGLCMVIIIILWENTSVLDDNLSVCAFSWTTANISVLCGAVIALGTINCLFSFIYYYFSY